MSARTPYARIARTLDAAAEAGRTVGFWWRDDDAVRPTPALERLLALSAAHGTAVTLAVVPSLAEPALAERLSDEPRVTVAVHGWSHANHAPPGEKQAEFGAHRPIGRMAEEATRGRAHLAELFPREDLALFVPPWNRIAPALVPALLAAGYRGVSGFGLNARRRGTRGPNTHVDPVEWRGSRRLLDTARIETAFVEAATSGESVGLLTHHLCFDEPLWSFCDGLLHLVARHPATALLSSGDLLTQERSGSNSDAVRDLSAKQPVPAECRP